MCHYWGISLVSSNFFRFDVLLLYQPSSFCIDSIFRYSKLLRVFPMKDNISLRVCEPSGSISEALEDHKKIVDDVVLIPQPSSDPNDPLVCWYAFKLSLLILFNADNKDSSIELEFEEKSDHYRYIVPSIVCWILGTFLWTTQSDPASQVVS